MFNIEFLEQQLQTIFPETQVKTYSDHPQQRKFQCDEFKLSIKAGEDDKHKQHCSFTVSPAYDHDEQISIRVVHDQYSKTGYSCVIEPDSDDPIIFRSASANRIKKLDLYRDPYAASNLMDTAEQWRIRIIDTQELSENICRWLHEFSRFEDYRLAALMGAVTIDAMRLIESPVVKPYRWANCQQAMLSLYSAAHKRLGTASGAHSFFSSAGSHILRDVMCPQDAGDSV